MNKYAKPDGDAFGGAHTIQQWIDQARIAKQYVWATRLVQVLAYVKLMSGKVNSLEQTIAQMSAEQVTK